MDGQKFPPPSEIIISSDQTSFSIPSMQLEEKITSNLEAPENLSKGIEEYNKINKDNLATAEDVDFSDKIVNFKQVSSDIINAKGDYSYLKDKPKEERERVLGLLEKPRYADIVYDGNGKPTITPSKEAIEAVDKFLPKNLDGLSEQEFNKQVEQAAYKAVFEDNEYLNTLRNIQVDKNKEIIDKELKELEENTDMSSVSPKSLKQYQEKVKAIKDKYILDPLLKDENFQKNLQDLLQASSTAVTAKNKEFGRYNNKFLNALDVLRSFDSPYIPLPTSLSLTMLEGVAKGGKQIMLMGEEALVGWDQEQYQNANEELLELQGKISRGEIKEADVKERISELGDIMKENSEEIAKSVESISEEQKELSYFNQADLEDGNISLEDVAMLVGEQIPQIGLTAAGAITANPILIGAGFLATTAQMYGDNYWSAIERGLTKDLKRTPTNEEITEAIKSGKYDNKAIALATAVAQSGIETYAGVKLGKGLNKALGAGKNSIGSVYKGEFKKAFNSLTESGKQVTKDALLGYMEESGQSLLNQISTGVQRGGVKNLKADLDAAERNIEGKAGAIVQAVLPFAGKVYSQARVEGRNILRDVATKFDLTSLEGIKQADAFFKAAQNDIDRRADLGEITPEQKQAESETVANIRNTGLKIPKNFSVSAKQKSFDLILERQKLQDKVNKEDEAFTGPDKERIKEINTELGNIQSVETATRAAVKAVEKADIDLNVIELDNEVDVENYLKENMNIAASKAKEAGKQRGFIMPDGKTIIIN
ncbi:MAG: hypothetical protein ACW98X_26585, partial [Promethearchaeota archaeon]